MTVDLKQLDAYAQPPAGLRSRWKGYSRAETPELLAGDVDDLSVPEKAAQFRVAGSIPAARIRKAFDDLDPAAASASPPVEEDAEIYHHPLLPGLLIVPALVPPAIQKSLLSRVVHRDLSNPQHQTNLHLHYDLPYPLPSSHTTGGPSEPSAPPPASFFTYPPTGPPLFRPKDPAVHRPLTIRQVLDRRLHWVTLGGQYDWTNRVYPDGGGGGAPPPPDFPPDVAAFLGALFPATRAEAAIVNFYTPGDTMMLHRDVSEETDRGLVSLSLGCEALFMVAPSKGPLGEGGGGLPGDEEDGEGGGRGFLLLRLRSGDAVYMTEESRYAWHGVPRVLKGTCPDYLEDWPAGEHEGGEFEEWRGWMKNKRINLNARQVRD